ncbi:hypothetical protein UFOVP1254_104 [uncultured Caudovirales phage]|uniref:Uncharacterized protein n=1 Tax=uncultured Caudovirales phage TaxID=2100421 RepID=A0A6J5RJZ9_9CAUD|nr:hypothetical protein UFOVP1254_104 [uncultured Caudovirales phage]
MSFYSELANTAREMLREFGQPVTVKKYETAIPNPVTGVVAPPTSTTTTEFGCLLDFEYRSFGDLTTIQTTVNASAKRMVMTSGTLLNSGDGIVVGQDEYRIHVIKTLSPAGTRVLYDLWIQK